MKRCKNVSSQRIWEIEVILPFWGKSDFTELKVQKLLTSCRVAQPVSNRWEWNLCLLSPVQLSFDHREYLFLEFIPFHFISLSTDFIYFCNNMIPFFIFFLLFQICFAGFSIPSCLLLSFLGLIKVLFPLQNFFTFSIAIFLNYFLLFLFPLRASERGLEILCLFFKKII